MIAFAPSHAALRPQAPEPRTRSSPASAARPSAPRRRGVEAAHCRAPAAAAAVAAAATASRRRARVARAAKSSAAAEAASAAYRGPPPDEVEVVTYNVLSSHLSQPYYYWHSNAEDLDPPTRLKRLFKKLQPAMQRGAVVCLQECSAQWTGRLHAFFQRRGYHFVASLYGRAFDGYMGVGIAFPTTVFEASDVTIQRISEAKSWPLPRKPEVKANGYLRTLLDFAGYFASPTVFEGLVGLEPVEEKEEGEPVRPEDAPKNPIAVDEWEYSRTRQNTMVAVKLRPVKGVDRRPFTVATYHMPCAYWAPKVMVIHTALAAQYAFRFADGSPLILAGDWNFKPGAAPYQLLTTGTLPEAHPAHPGYPEGETWRVDKGLAKLRSAYAEKNPSGEPEFTNYAWVKDDMDPFIGTLDYIFVSEGAQILSVLRLPGVRESPTPLPTKDEPSDHLMLSTRLRPYARREVVKTAKQPRGLSRPSPTKASEGSSGSLGRGFALRRPSAGFGGGLARPAPRGLKGSGSSADA